MVHEQEQVWGHQTNGLEPRSGRSGVGLSFVGLKDSILDSSRPKRSRGEWASPTGAPGPAPVPPPPLSQPQALQVTQVTQDNRGRGGKRQKPHVHLPLE